MSKKIKVTLNRSMMEILENDMEDFKLSRDAFMNYLFYHLKDEEILPFNDLIIPEVTTEKVNMQFNLNKNNSEIYYDVLKSKKAMNESKFFRMLIKKYTSNSKHVREIFMFKEIVERILLAIEDKKVVLIMFKDGRSTLVTPYHISSSGLEIANYIFCYDMKENKYKNYKLVNIKFVETKNFKSNWDNKEYIEQMKENFNPFLSDGKHIKVRFNEEGLELFKNLKTHRPNIVEEVDKYTYILDSSFEQATRYFSFFIENIHILEPEDLRKQLLEKYKKAVKNLEE